MTTLSTVFFTQQINKLWYHYLIVIVFRDCFIVVLNVEKLEVKWLNFSQHCEQIRQFRHSIYIQEQGLNQQLINSEEDQHGLHLAALMDDEIVSKISGFFVKWPDRADQTIMRFGMRMENKNIRGSGLSEHICNHMGVSCYETIKPDMTYVELFPEHAKLAQHYIDWGFVSVSEPKNPQDKTQLCCDGPAQQLAQYQLNKQKLKQSSLLFSKVKLPVLSNF